MVAAVLAAPLWTFMRDSHAYVILFVPCRSHNARSLQGGARAGRDRLMSSRRRTKGSLVPPMRTSCSTASPPIRDGGVLRATAGPNGAMPMPPRLRRIWSRTSYTLGDPFFGSRRHRFRRQREGALDPDLRIYNDNAPTAPLPLGDDVAFVHGTVAVSSCRPRRGRVRSPHLWSSPGASHGPHLAYHLAVSSRPTPRAILLAWPCLALRLDALVGAPADVTRQRNLQRA